MNANDSIDSQEREILELAAIGLALSPDGPRRMLTKHRITPDRYCAECGQPWYCRFALIALYAQEYRNQAQRAAAQLISPPPFADDHDLFDSATADDVVPPVIPPDPWLGRE